MQHVFTIIEPNETSTTGGITENTINLLSKYTNNDTTIEEIQSSVKYYCSWSQVFDLENLDQTRQILENSCTDKLKDEVNKEMLDVDPIHQEGPMLFFIMMQIIVQTSDQATGALLQRLKNLNISDIRVVRMCKLQQV